MKSTTAGLKLFLVWSWKEWIATGCKKRDKQTTEDKCHQLFNVCAEFCTNCQTLKSRLTKFGTKPDPQPLWFFHLVKASLVKLAKFGNIYYSGHKILISVLAAFHKAKKTRRAGNLVWVWVGSAVPETGHLKSTTARLKLYLFWSWKKWIMQEKGQTTEDGCHHLFNVCAEFCTNCQTLKSGLTLPNPNQTRSPSGLIG